MLANVSAITASGLRPILEALWRAAASREGSPLFLDGATDGERVRMLGLPVVISGREWR